MIIITNIFFIVGFIIMFFGILGIIILPDIFLRFHASTKCGVTGAFNILIGLILTQWDWQFTIKISLIILFIFFTAPIISHMLAISYLKHKHEGEEN